MTEPTLAEAVEAVRLLLQRCAYAAPELCRAKSGEVALEKIEEVIVSALPVLARAAEMEKERERDTYPCGCARQSDHDPVTCVACDNVALRERVARCDELERKLTSATKGWAAARRRLYRVPPGEDGEGGETWEGFGADRDQTCISLEGELAARDAEVARLRRSSPDDLRERGWFVAVHNDYTLNGGERQAFWGFSKDGRWIRGEGSTDADALDAARAALADESIDEVES